MTLRTDVLARICEPYRKSFAAEPESNPMGSMSQTRASNTLRNISYQ